jgi:predicted nucleic acid-binding protein
MNPTPGLEQTFVVVDASIWVARLVSQDEFHEAVKRWMVNKRTKGVQFISPTLLLAEVGGAHSLKRRLPSWKPCPVYGW